MIETMEISFETDKVAKLFNSMAALNKKFGELCGKRIAQRLQELEAVESLEDMVFGRPHELVGDRAGQVSLDLVHPLRLIIRPTDDPPPAKPDGGIDRPKVKRVTILEAVDTH